MVNAITSLDTQILHAFTTQLILPVTVLMIDISELGSVEVVFGITVVAALIYAYKRQFVEAAALAASVFGTAGAVVVLKELIHRARPDMIYQAYPETGYSFPSAHAALSVALYGFLGYLICTRAASRGVRATFFFLSLILPALIGFTRIYLGVHYTSDVIGGFIVGIVVLCLAILFLKRTKGWLNSRQTAS